MEGSGDRTIKREGEKVKQKLNLIEGKRNALEEEKGEVACTDGKWSQTVLEKKKKNDLNRKVPPAKSPRETGRCCI